MFPVLKDEDMQKVEIGLSETIKGVKSDSLILKTIIINMLQEVQQSLQQSVS